MTDDEGQMARTLLDIKDKLLELSKKNSQIGNYNSQVEEIEKFAQYAESFKVNFIKKQELEEKIYRLLCACKIIIADREALSEQNSSDLEKIQEKINNEQYLIQSAQVASEQKSLDAILSLLMFTVQRLKRQTAVLPKEKSCLENLNQSMIMQIILNMKIILTK